MKILLGVSGSIAAYKSADIISRLVKDGHNVHPVLTNGASKFITALTLQALSKNKVHTDVFADDEPSEISHINLPQSCDMFLVAPASANTIAKISNGLADDILSAMALAYDGNLKFIAPAMNEKMYNNKATQRNIQTLKDDGWQIIKPRVARLACGYEGEGALAKVDDIIKAIYKEENYDKK